MFATAVSNDTKDNECMFLEFIRFNGQRRYQAARFQFLLLWKEAASKDAPKSLVANAEPIAMSPAPQHRDTSNKKTTSRSELESIQVTPIQACIRFVWKLVWCGAGGAVSSLSSRSPGDALDATLLDLPQPRRASLRLLSIKNVCNIIPTTRSQ